MSLPAPYNTVVAILENEDNPSLKDVKLKLLNEYAKVKGPSSAPKVAESQSAMVSGQFNGNGRHSNGAGHLNFGFGRRYNDGNCQNNSQRDSNQRFGIVQSSHSNYSSSGRDYKCFNCGKPGHLSRDCRLKANNSGSDHSQIKCNNCNRFGHTVGISKRDALSSF